MQSFARLWWLLLMFFLLVPVSSDAVLDDFRRTIRERFDPGQSYGLYQKTLEIVAPFETVCRQLEANVQESEWELLTHWELDPPDVCDTRARVYLLRYEEYDRAVLAKGARRLVFLPVRIGVFQEGPKVVVVFTNPEFLAKVFFADLPFVEQDEMLALSGEIKKDLVTFCVKGMEGTILTEQLPPIRNDRDVRFFWSRYQEHFDVVRQVPVRVDPVETLQRVCDRIEKAVPAAKTGWRMIARTPVADQACILSVSHRRVEDQALDFSGIQWPSVLDRDPCSGLYHLTQFPLEILVFLEGGEVRVGILDQFWRMRFYLWDDPYRTGTTFMARDPNFSGRVYESLRELVRGP